MKNNSIAVVICTYNGEKYIAEQLDSVLRQTHPADEIIIQDDNSTDSTFDILTEYANKCDTIKLFRNKSSLGINKNFFSAMFRASSTFIAICDQDDLWESDKLEIQLDNIGDSMLCAGRSKPFSDDGSFVYYDKRLPNITPLRMMYCAEIAGHTMMIRRDMLQSLPLECKIFSRNYYDIIFSVVAAINESVVYLDKILVRQRRHADASTYSSNSSSLPSASNGLRILFWCICHYNYIKREGNYYYIDWLELLLKLNVKTTVANDSIKMMRLQTKSGLLNFIKFQMFCLKHRRDIFHTEGSALFNFPSALLFPIMKL